MNEVKSSLLSDEELSELSELDDDKIKPQITSKVVPLNESQIGQGVSLKNKLEANVNPTKKNIKNPKQTKKETKPAEKVTPGFNKSTRSAQKSFLEETKSKEQSITHKQGRTYKKNPLKNDIQIKSKTPLVSPINAITPLMKTKKRIKDDNSLTEMN